MKTDLEQATYNITASRQELQKVYDVVHYFTGLAIKPGDIIHIGLAAMNDNVNGRVHIEIKR